MSLTKSDQTYLAIGKFSVAFEHAIAGVRECIVQLLTRRGLQGDDLACPVAAVMDWLSSAGITRGPVFRRMGRGGRVFSAALSPYSIGQVVKRYVEAAGLDPAEFGGHSLRAGFITSAIGNGSSVFRTMDVSLHRRVETLRGYVRRAEEFKDHAGDGLL
jgi:integrase